MLTERVAFRFEVAFHLARGRLSLNHGSEAAAGAMDISPQMVAKHVVHLETRLGTVLLSRTTRRQSLTEIGRSSYERCKLILAETETAETLAREMRRQPKGLLRISAPVTFGSSALVPFLLRYLALYPEVQVELVLSDRRVDALEDGFEVIFRLGEVRAASLTAVPLRPYRILACAAPAYLAAHGLPARAVVFMPVWPMSMASPRPSDIGNSAATARAKRSRSAAPFAAMTGLRFSGPPLPGMAWCWAPSICWPRC
ncbi:transcriptional regulator, LysR family (plasmid) [Paracoccus aminophilus JCM 7686]|uniref:Transcriptional regulator, LysR family n=1 Tax=Paracoccus aminophilus JCM 7686 TaxID=1367847 RepID=S5Y047_PARAH|nr:transcriptional regulator, LysR family [Paracoccus aminophilus JCM 7686]